MASMSDATPATVAPAHPPGPPDQRQGRSAGLLGLIDRLCGFGHALTETLRRRDPADGPTAAIAWTFASLSLALILTRITRGLRIAEALQARIIRRARHLDAPSPRVRGALKRSRPPRSPHAPHDEAAELANPPSAREIAERIRHKSIGNVIVEICRDLGIDREHPMWREVMEAIAANDGCHDNLLNILKKRAFDAIRSGIRPTRPQAVELSAFFRLIARDPPPPPWPGLRSGWATPPP